MGNAHWAVTPLAPVLQDAGILEDGREVVFYGVDSAELTIRDNVGVLEPGNSGKVTDDGEVVWIYDHRTVRTEHVDR